MALEHGLNTILLPILDSVEQLLARGCQLGSCMATWETARISHLPRLVEAACQGNTQLGSLAQLREATSGMLRVLHAMSVAGEKAQVSSLCAECAARAFAVGAACEQPVCSAFSPAEKPPLQMHSLSLSNPTACHLTICRNCTELA